jgi:DNA-binding transcriptional LysR family regulator
MQNCIVFTWDDARCFLAVQRTRSLSEAGRRLGINQSTVGRRLRALEEALGAVLFVRTPDGYALAPAGERLVPHAERIEDAALAFEREASGRQTALTGTVRITGPDAFSAQILAPLIGELQARAPGIDVELLAENRTLSITKREADIAVRTFRPREPALVTRRLCELASMLYASKEYLAAHPAKGDLGAHTFVSVDDATWAEGVWLHRTWPSARVAFKTNSTPTQLAATAAGIGIGILPCYLADAEPRLVRVGQERVVVRHVWIALHRDLQHAGRIRACADHLAGGIVAQAPRFAGTAVRRSRA